MAQANTNHETMTIRFLASKIRAMDLIRVQSIPPPTRQSVVRAAVDEYLKKRETPGA